MIEPTGQQQFYYLEPQNVTSVHGLWGYWGSKTTMPNSGRYYKFLLPVGPPPSPPPPSECKVLSTAHGKDIEGGHEDLTQVQAGVHSSADCEAACCKTAGCNAFVFVPKALTPYGKCTDPSLPCCFLKKTASSPQEVPCPARFNSSCVAVTMKTPLAPSAPAGYTGTSPPSGIRSAVPLGGISCGTVELRGDGSFSEWTIMNRK